MRPKSLALRRCRRLLACLLGCGAALASAQSAENPDSADGWVPLAPLLQREEPAAPRTLMPEAAPNAGEEEAPAAAPTPEDAPKTEPAPDEPVMGPHAHAPAPESTEAPPVPQAEAAAPAAEPAAEPSQPSSEPSAEPSSDAEASGSSSASAVEEDDESGEGSSGLGGDDASEDEAAKAPVRHVTPIPHGFVPVSLEERLQSLRSGSTEDEILVESAAVVDPASLQRAVDEAFLEKQSFEGAASSNAAAAGQAAEAAGRATAELLVDPPVDPLERALLAPSMSPYDKLFLEARDAYQRGDADDLLIYRKIFVGHPLEGYLEFWALALALKAEPDAPDTNMAMQSFIERHQGEYLGETAAAHYLREVGGRLNPLLFDAIDQKLVWNADDAVITAWRLRYRLASAERGVRQKALTDAKIHYRDGNVLTPAIRELGDDIVARDRSWAWDRVIILLQKGRWDEVKRALPYVPRPELPASIETLNDILERPTVWFNRTEADGRRISARLAVFAALRLARTQPEMAEKTVLKVEARLSAFWRALLWSRIGYHAVVSLNPDAPRWYARADRGGLRLNPLLVVDRDGLAAWEARAALRAGNFYTLGGIIDRMPEHLRRTEIWTYWRARSYLARGLRDQAEPLLRRIAGNTTFYGKLASDALGIPYALERVRAKTPTPEELARWDDHPSLERAILFYRMHLYWDGHREWNWAMRGIKGRDYVILADWAGSRMLVHRMINTSLRSGDESLIEQRFPTPHKTLVERVSSAQQIPMSWVYGLIRQESRFIPAVKSSVGAQGLMQVMPATAAWIANRIGVEDYRDEKLTDLEMNLVLGTAYLRMLYAELDQSFVLATAAYNAGPARARVWRATLKDPMEAAVFIETIPFHETRDYVKNVLANMQTYSMRTDQPVKSFTRLLGRVLPASASKSELP